MYIYMYMYIYVYIYIYVYVKAKGWKAAEKHFRPQELALLKLDEARPTGVPLH